LQAQRPETRSNTRVVQPQIYSASFGHFAEDEATASATNKVSHKRRNKFNVVTLSHGTEPMQAERRRAQEFAPIERKMTIDSGPNPNGSARQTIDLVFNDAASQAVARTQSANKHITWLRNDQCLREFGRHSSSLPSMVDNFAKSSPKGRPASSTLCSFQARMKLFSSLWTATLPTCNDFMASYLMWVP